MLNGQIAGSDQRLALSAMYRPETNLLLGLPGLSLQVAVGLLAAIGHISRFPSPRHLVSYLGLDPLGKRSAEPTSPK